MLLADFLERADIESADTSLLAARIQSSMGLPDRVAASNSFFLRSSSFRVVVS
ncbi:hypothetical protein ACVWZZ_006582 [Bradyrhizobium sp. LM6.10]